MQKLSIDLSQIPGECAGRVPGKMILGSSLRALPLRKRGGGGADLGTGVSGSVSNASKLAGVLGNLVSGDSVYLEILGTGKLKHSSV